MAYERPRGQRGLASLTGILLLVLLSAAGCSTDAPAGWFAPDGARAVSTLELRPGDELAVRVELPRGYVAAELVQRASLQVGATVVTGEAVVTDERTFVLELAPPKSSLEPEEGVLDLVLGFCEPEAKELCFFDMPSLPVRIVNGANADETDVGLPILIYRPEAPQ
ncbi:MAG: hypothetical protein ACOC1U_06780 [Spirochaetota bacterium]